MIKMSPAARAVPPSGIREIMNLVLERGGDVAKLVFGEPDFEPPPHVKRAAMEAAQTAPRYTHSAGILALREAISAKLARVNGLSYGPDQIVVSQGGIQGISAVFTALVEPGDEILVPDPGFASYGIMVPLHGAVAVPYALPASAGFVPDPDEVAKLITARTKLIVVNSPGNPTGAVFPADVVERLVRIATRAGVAILSDEVYDELVFDGFAANAAKYDPEHVIGIYSFSKTYAMTGWRTGYVACEKELAAVLAKIQVPLISCVSAVSQAAALAALTGPQDCVHEMRDAYRTRRDLVVQLLSDAGIDVHVPSGAFYLMLPLARGADSRRAALDLVEHGVAVAPGAAFGHAASDCLRLSLAANEATLRTGIERLVGWYRKTDAGRSATVDQ